MIRRVVGWIAAAVVIAGVIVTLIPLSSSSAWWVRMWEFPRLHVLAAMLVAFVLAAWGLRAGPRGWILLAALIVAGVQSFWVWRYMPWTAEDVAIAPGEGVQMVALNVLQGNDDHARVAAWLEAADPDVLLLMETDATWAAALAPVLDGYAHRVERIADDNYGMILASRLPMEGEMRYPSRDDEPAAVATIEGPSGPFTFVGLHPHPPIPMTSAEARDRQIAMAARLGQGRDMPVVAMGDFNDVAWSRAAQRYRDLGGFLDPRKGRGIKASFDASSWWLRFPIDQALVTEGVAVHSFSIGPDVGSDHFPILMEASVATR